MSLNKISINDTTTVNTGVVYDITKASGQSYDSLSAALGTGGNNVPSEVREGGMTIRFVSNSDNKYVQYRLMTQTFSTNEDDWQGVDDEPTAGSDNLVKSGGVFSSITTETSSLQNKTERIDREDAEAETREAFVIESDSGDVVLNVDENGLDAKNIKSNGTEVLTEKDKITQIDKGIEEAEAREEQVFCSDDFNEETGDGELFAKINQNGIQAKGFFDLEGNPISIKTKTFYKGVFYDYSEEGYMPKSGGVYFYKVASYGTKIRIYRLKKGTYRLKGNVQGGNWAAIAYSKSLPTDGSILQLIEPCTEEVTSIDKIIDLNDGYLCIFDNNQNPVKVSLKRDVKYNTDIALEYGAKLVGRDIVILGDSIMQHMDSSSIMCIYWFEDDEGNKYEYDSSLGEKGSYANVKIVNGIPYDSTTLDSDGSVLPSSKRLKVVNPPESQEGFDNRTWEDIMNFTQAKTVHNLGLGGSGYQEGGLITDCPSVGFVNDLLKYGSEMAPMTNEIRWLARMTDTQKWEKPDCIIMWASTNDRMSEIPTNYDEIMNVPYSTLADDIEGRIYRNTFFGGLRYCLETIYRKYPYATTIVLTAAQTSNADNGSEYFRTYQEQERKAECISKMCARYATPVINVASTNGLPSLRINESDDIGATFEEFMNRSFIHPAQLGNNMWAKYLCMVLNNHYFNKV